MSRRQLQLPLAGEESSAGPARLDPLLWRGSFNAHESAMQQLAPYVGKMKSGMARALIAAYSREGETVLDPFCGSGVVPFEALLLDRHAIGNDLNPYAYVLTMGKLTAPRSLRDALDRADHYLKEAEARSAEVRLETVPKWVREFFHPQTLIETIGLLSVLRANDEYFLQACILGILHHVRPGFLSYPASHLVPYLRTKLYPPERFPGMYSYRDVRSRFLAKVRRAYRRHNPFDARLQWRVLQENATALSIPDRSVEAIVSSPPYFGALDYGRDNRLRLWFLGVDDYKEVDRALTSNDRVYVPQMTQAVKEMHRLLKVGGAAVLVLGDYRRNGRRADSADTIAGIARHHLAGKLLVEDILDDRVPDERRSRRRTRTTLEERVLVLRKVE